MVINIPVLDFIIILSKVNTFLSKCIYIVCPYRQLSKRNEIKIRIFFNLVETDKLFLKDCGKLSID